MEVAKSGKRRAHLGVDVYRIIWIAKLIGWEKSDGCLNQAMLISEQVCDSSEERQLLGLGQSKLLILSTVGGVELFRA